jgi:O-antigen/teichoic acid export membrane protein
VKPTAENPGTEAGIEAVLEQSAPGPPIASGQSVAQRLVRGSTIYALTNFGLRAMNFLLIALYTRHLTPGDYGIISLAEITGAAVASVTSLGLDASLRRLFFGYKNDATVLRTYVSSVLRFGIAFTLSILFVVLTLGPAVLRRFAPGFVVPFFPYLAIAITSACMLQVLDYFFGLYQVQEKPRSFAKLSLLLFVLTAGCVVALVVVHPLGARGMLLGKLIGATLALVIAGILLRHWLTGGMKWDYVRETLHLALPIVPHQMLALGLIMADRFILEHYRPIAEVGIYSLAYTFGMVMYLVTASLSQAWSPIFYDLAAQGDQNKPTLARIVSAVVTVLTIIACLGASISHDFLRFFLDVRYSAAAPLIPWIIGGYLLHALFTLFHVSAFQARKSQFIWMASMTAFVVNIALNFLWVPRWGMFGAAWATAVGYAVEALLMYFYAQRVYHLPYKGWRMVLDMTIFSGILWATQVPWSLTSRPLIISAVLIAAILLLILSAGRDFQQSVRMLIQRRAS